MRELWIIDRHKGQLGNRLMFFAAAYAWCLEEGAKLYCPTFYRYAELFPALAGQKLISPNDPSPVDWPRELRERRQARLAAWLRAPAKLHLLPGVVRKPSGCSAVALPPTQPGFPDAGVRRKRRLFMLAWRFFNPVGVRKHREEILRATTPQPDVEADAERFIAGLDPARRWIGAHIRGRDYGEFLGGKHLHSLATYNAQMRAAAERLAGSGGPGGVARPVGFVIFADEARRAEEFPGLDVVISGGSPIQDLARMSRLKMVVGPMSTFTAWAMFRAGGVAWQFGPPPSEDGLDWVYSGYPVARTLETAAMALEQAERVGGGGEGGRFEPEIDLSAGALRPAK